MLTRRLTAALVAAVLVFAACGGNDDGDDADAGTTTTTEPASSTLPGEGEVERETVEQAVDLTIEGAEDVELSERVKLDVLVRRAGGDVGLENSVGTMLFETPVAIDGGRTVSTQIGLVGMYDGDGDYEIKAGTGLPVPTSGPTVPSEATGTEGISVAEVSVFQGDRQTRYGYLLEACDVHVEDDFRTGEATCPALVAPDGDKVSLHVVWGEE